MHKGTVQPDKIRLKVIALDRPRIGRYPPYVYDFLILILNFKTSSKICASSYKNPSNLLILQQTACIKSSLHIC